MGFLSRPIRRRTIGGWITYRIEKAGWPVNSIIKVMGTGEILLNRWGKAVSGWTLWGSARIMGGVQGRGVLDSLPYGAATGGGLERFWEAVPERLVLWIAVLAILVAVAIYVIGKIHPKTVQKEREADQWLIKCRELHSRGELSDEEFRTIKTNLAAQLQEELNDNGDKG